MFVMATQEYINERYSLLERASLGLTLLLVIVLFNKVQIKQLYVPTALILLLGAMGVSIFQIPATFIFQDFFAYALLSFYAIILISAFGVSAGVNGVVVSAFFLILANLGLILASDWSQVYEDGRLVGTSYGSNTLAASLVITLPAILIFRTKNKTLTTVFRITLISCLGMMIFLTGARTAWVSFLLVLASWCIYIAIIKLGKKAFPLVFVFVFIVALVLINLSNVVNLLGKDLSFGGRIPLWEKYIEKIAENPIVGYGWSFQTRIDMPLGSFIAESLGVPLTNAHNDFLNWWALTGLFGVLLFVVILLSFILSSFIFKDYELEKKWLFLTGVCFAINGITELTTMYADGWFLLSLGAVTWAWIARNQNKKNNSFINFLSKSPLMSKS